jgi:D-alanyl-D-alanine carboxypeptidase
MCVTWLLLAGCSSSPSSAPPTSGRSATTSSTSTGGAALADEVSSIRRILRGAVDAQVFPGAVVVVRRDGQSRTVAVGRADIRTRAPMTAADRFQVASLTKSMVAATAMELVARGRLSLSDTVEKWEPGLLPRGADITVADLLGQTSGLPDYTPKETAHYVSGRTATAPPAMVALVAHEPLQFPPGSRSFYSNTNYLVLGMILQTASHQSLASLLQQRLFGPLGLRSASLAPSRTQTPPLAHGYEGDEEVTNPELAWLWAAGGVVSNVGDVARFYDDLLSGKVVHGHLLQRMLTMRKETNHELEFSGYGLGIATIPTRCGTAYGASGVVRGFFTHAWTSKDHTRSVVIAVNASPSTEVNDQVGTVINEALCDP